MDIVEDEIIEHPRSIIHVDMDCYYAQVEMVQHPEHKDKPLGVQQKNIVVTSNYLARQFGIKKCMSVQEALSLCPGLVLIRGEDLTRYRQVSARIFEILQRYTPFVERLGLDEYFIDATTLIQREVNNSSSSSWSRDSDGDLSKTEKSFGDPDEECPCGCHGRLLTASKVTADIRLKIMKELGLTCSAGIAHNKLLAKLGGNINKPNGQTLIYPFAASSLLTSVGPVSKIPGVGQKMTELLQVNNITTIEELRRIPLENLELKIGKDLARKLKDWAEGIDESTVKPSSKPQSIGIEDGVKNISLVDEVESRLGALLRRLTELATEDGRIPVAMKLTVRKHDMNKPNSGKRETRQCALPQHILPLTKSGVYDHTKMLVLLMKLFHRAVDVTKPFHLTLLGVAFTKFQERSSGRSSITSFLRKQVAVQSVLDISSDEGIFDTKVGSPMSTNQDSNDASDCSFANLDNSLLSISSDSINSPKPHIDNCQQQQQQDDEDLPSETEPSPKKTKLEVWLRESHRESPSNEMASLRLGPSSSSSSSSSSISTPSRKESVVFQSLPLSLQREMSHWPVASKTKANNIYKQFITNK